MLKHIRVFPLILGIVIGIIAIILVKPPMNVVHKYPTPENANKLTYKDKNNVCYKYNSTKVNCDKNESKLKDFPLNN